MARMSFVTLLLSIGMAACASIPEQPKSVAVPQKPEIVLTLSDVPVDSVAAVSTEEGLGVLGSAKREYANVLCPLIYSLASIDDPSSVETITLYVGERMDFVIVTPEYKTGEVGRMAYWYPHEIPEELARYALSQTLTPSEPRAEKRVFTCDVDERRLTIYKGPIFNLPFEET